MGNTMTNGSGSVSPGNGSNGQSFGYSIAGGSDSENSYLVEGQETANLIGGYSHTNVPFDFIQEVEVKSSGVQAEYGGALGGVVNVVMKKGTAQFHGSVFVQFENQGLDAGPNGTSRYDPLSAPTATNWATSASSLPACSTPVTTGCFPGYQGFSDANYQSYQNSKDHYSDVRPGFTLGGPLLPFLSSAWRDKVFFFVGFNPDLSRDARSVNYGPASAGNPATGVIPFSQNTNTYYTTARIDVQARKKIRVFGSWLYQLQKQYGEQLPFADSVQALQLLHGGGQFNLSSGNARNLRSQSGFHGSKYNGQHWRGHYDLPKHRFDDSIRILLRELSRLRLPWRRRSGDMATSGFGQTTGCGKWTDWLTITNYNSSKAIELTRIFRGSRARSSARITSSSVTSSTETPTSLCRYITSPSSTVSRRVLRSWKPSWHSKLRKIIGTQVLVPVGCQGAQRRWICDHYDFGTGGHAIAYDNGFYGQDSWTAGRGITIDAGIRAEKEFLPGEAFGGGAPAEANQFGWKDKIAPRIGVAWDVFRNGKMKVFGGYGQFYDQMNLNVAISSFGGQYWNNCSYVLT